MTKPQNPEAGKPARSLAELVRVAEVAPECAQQMEPGEYPFVHATHLSDGWLELRTEQGGPPARVRVDHASATRLHAAGLLSKAELQQLEARAQ